MLCLTPRVTGSVPQGKKIGGFVSYLENVDAILLEKCNALDSLAFYSPAVQVPYCAGPGGEETERHATTPRSHGACACAPAPEGSAGRGRGLHQIKAFQHRAALLVHQTASAIALDVSSGLTFEQAWNNALVEVGGSIWPSVESPLDALRAPTYVRRERREILASCSQLARATKAHCKLSIVVNFINAVAEIKTTHPSLHAPLERLCHLFTLHTLEEELGEFTEDGYLSMQQVALVRGNVRDLLNAIRPDAVALVDSFNLSDHELNSALGRYDGRAYETLYEWAQQSPLNKTQVTSGYADYLRPMFKKQGIFASRL